jgi:hypothetical protein
MSDQRLNEPVVPDMLSDLGSASDDGDPRRSSLLTKRALWISLVAILAIAATSFLLALHFSNRTPAGLKTPQHVAGLTLDTSDNAKNTADYLRNAFAAGANMTTSVGAVYTDGGSTAESDAHSVIFVGGTAKGSDPTLLTKMLNQLDDATDGITGVVTAAPGSLGGLMKCGLTTDTTSQDATTPTEMAVCAFADGGDVGIALFPNRTIDEAAGLMRQIRAGVQ